MHIPECAEVVGSKFVQKGTESCGIGINSACFDKKNNAGFFRIGNKCRNGRSYGFFVVIKCNGADIRNFKVVRNVDKFFNGAGVSGNGNIDRRIYARDSDSAFAEISYG